IGGGVNEHEVCPEVAGAIVVTAVGLTTTSAVSWRPASSVTVSATVPIPHAGSVTEALALPAFCSVSDAPLTLLHGQPRIVWDATAALPEPSSCTTCPAASAP